MVVESENHLDRLFDVISEIAEIDLVEITDSGTFEVEYTGGTTPPTGIVAQVNDVLANWITNKARFDQIDEKNAFYDNAVSSGYIVTTGTLTTSELDGKNFPLDHESLSYLTMQLLAAETTSSSSVDVEANDGTTATLSLADLRSLLVSYADAAQTIRKNRLTDIKTINDTFNGYDGGGGYTTAVP